MDSRRLEKTIRRLIENWHVAHIPAIDRTRCSIRTDNIPTIAARIIGDYDRIRAPSSVERTKFAAVICCTLAERDNFSLLFHVNFSNTFNTDKWKKFCRFDLALESFLAILKCDSNSVPEETKNELKEILAREAPQALTLAFIGRFLEAAYPGI